jgi:hypothetical protein
MDRRAFVTGLGAVLAAPLAAEQQAGKVYRLGYLSGIADPSVPRIGTFRQAMAALGWKDLGFGSTTRVAWHLSFASGVPGA